MGKMKSITKKMNMVWIITFAILIVSPGFVYFLIGSFVDTANYENRNAAEQPQLNIGNIAAFPQEYEAYFNDHIPFRNQLVQLNSRIDYFVFRQSSSDAVEIGKDGWLFYCAADNGDPIEQVLGKRLFTEEDLRVIADNLVSMRNKLQ